MWTKRQLIEQAFAEIGLATDAFNVAPEHMQRALNSLDAMMGTWNAKGIRLGYALPSGPDASNIDADSGLPDGATEAAFLNLALRIAPSFGKTVQPSTQKSADEAYRALLLHAAQPSQQQLPNTLPRGAGNKPWRYERPFFPQPCEPITASEGGDPIEFN